MYVVGIHFLIKLFKLEFADNTVLLIVCLNIIDSKDFKETIVGLKF